jgi:UDP-N-acetylglucosamine--N-acetylmuramyl-(pentapeptide) pyrophosphoryl-undecaprenol N-acetylglucosamine transferase
MIKKVIIGAGGTGGHMFPAASVAKELKQLGYDIILITDSRGMRFAKDFSDNLIIEISAKNIRQGNIISRLKSVIELIKSIYHSMVIIKQHNVHAVIGFGGYPSFPATMAGFLMRKSLFLHEQNAILGRTNKFLKNFATSIFTSFKETIGLKQKNNILYTGNPVREQIAFYTKSPYPSFEDSFRILVTGGSQGASIFSETLPQMCELLPKDIKQKIFITHQTRPEDKSLTEKKYQQIGIKVNVCDFIDDMGKEIAESHLIICRSGASTIAEINLIGRPALYVPLPTAADDQQTINANYSVQHDAARLVRQQDFTPTFVAAMITEFFKNFEKLEIYAYKAQTMGIENSAFRIADTIHKTLQKY